MPQPRVAITAVAHRLIPTVAPNPRHCDANSQPHCVPQPGIGDKAARESPHAHTCRCRAHHGRRQHASVRRARRPRQEARERRDINDLLAITGEPDLWRRTRLCEKNDSARTRRPGARTFARSHASRSAATRVTIN